MLVISQFSSVALLLIAKDFLVDWPLSKWSFMKLPSIASSMGLTRIKSNYIKKFGEIRGEIRDHQIHALPYNSMNPNIGVGYRVKHSGLPLSLRNPCLILRENTTDFIPAD